MDIVQGFGGHIGQEAVLGRSGLNQINYATRFLPDQMGANHSRGVSFMFQAHSYDCLCLCRRNFENFHFFSIFSCIFAGNSPKIM